VKFQLQIEVCGRWFPAGPGILDRIPEYVAVAKWLREMYSASDFRFVAIRGIVTGD